MSGVTLFQENSRRLSHSGDGMGAQVLAPEILSVQPVYDAAEAQLGFPRLRSRLIQALRSRLIARS